MALRSKSLRIFRATLVAAVNERTGMVYLIPQTYDQIPEPLRTIAVLDGHTDELVRKIDLTGFVYPEIKHHPSLYKPQY